MINVSQEIIGIMKGDKMVRYCSVCGSYVGTIPVTPKNIDKPFLCSECKKSYGTTQQIEIGSFKKG